MLGDEWLKCILETLYPKFDRWLRSATSSGCWSESNPKGQLIPWKSFKAASGHSSKKAQFDSPGCYMFGWGAEYGRVVPRYVGQTTDQTLKKRLSGR